MSGTTVTTKKNEPYEGFASDIAQINSGLGNKLTDVLGRRHRVLGENGQVPTLDQIERLSAPNVKDMVPTSKRQDFHLALLALRNHIVGPARKQVTTNASTTLPLAA